MDKGKNNKTRFPGPGMISLCIAFAATAIVFQNAFSSRAQLFSEDEALPSILGSISPVAVVFLAAGYVISVLAIIYDLRRRNN